MRDQVTPANYIEEAVLNWFGERCSDHEPGCSICQAWEAYDELTMPKPDWEGFGRAVMESWPRYTLDCFDIEEEAKRYGLIEEVQGGFNPEMHEDIECVAEPGDPWFRYLY